MNGGTHLDGGEDDGQDRSRDTATRACRRIDGSGSSDAPCCGRVAFEDIRSRPRCMARGMVLAPCLGHPRKQGAQGLRADDGAGLASDRTSSSKGSTLRRMSPTSPTSSTGRASRILFLSATLMEVPSSTAWPSGCQRRSARSLFLDAFLPTNGERLVEKSTPAFREAIASAIGRGEISFKSPPASAFGVTGSDGKWVDAKTTPQPSATFTEAAVYTGARDRIAKKMFIRASLHSSPHLRRQPCESQSRPLGDT